MKIMNLSRLAAVFLLGVAASVPDAFVFAAETAAATPVAVGDVAVANFNLDGAIRAYRTALSEQPYNYEASWKLARTLLDKATLTTDKLAQKTLIEQARHKMSAMSIPTATTTTLVMKKNIFICRN